MTPRTHEREQFLADILITAVEGGTGYWAAVSNYHWSNEDPASTRVTLHELNDETGAFDGDTHEVTIDSIAKGVGLVVKGELANSVITDDVKTGDDLNDASYIDADGADVIVQAALFGKLVYG